MLTCLWMRCLLRLGAPVAGWILLLPLRTLAACSDRGGRNSVHFDNSGRRRTGGAPMAAIRVPTLPTNAPIIGASLRPHHLPRRCR